MPTVRITVDPGTIVDIAYWDDPNNVGVAVVAPLNGVTAVGSPSSRNKRVALSGVGATGAVGNVTTLDKTVALTNVRATGLVGTVNAVLSGGSKTMALAGVGAAGAVGSVAVLGSDADWVARSTAAGVAHADRLESSFAAASSPPGGGVPWVLADGTEGHVTRDTGLKVANAAASTKFAVADSDFDSGGNLAFPMRSTFGNGATLWWSYRVRTDAVGAYTPWNAPVETGTKLCTIGTSGNSHNSNTVVNQINYNFGMISGYYYDNMGGGPVPDLAFTGSWGADFKWQPSIDNGTNPLGGVNPDTGSVWTAQEQATRQFGGLFSGKTAARSRRGYGDPLAGGFRQYPDEWITVTNRLVIGAFGSADSRWTMWAARDGQPYTLLHDLTNIALGNDVAYDTLWLLPYTTVRQPGGRKVSSRTTNIGGTTIVAVGTSTPIGDGTLEYVASTSLFRWKAAGQSYGSARGFSAGNNILTVNLKSAADGAFSTLSGGITLPVASFGLADASTLPSAGSGHLNGDGGTTFGAILNWTGKSGNTLTGVTVSAGGGTYPSGTQFEVVDFIAVQITPASLPSSSTVTDTVTIADGRPNTQVNYNDAIVSTQAINAPGGFAPMDTLPPWVPAAGHITNVGLNVINTASSVNPKNSTLVNPNYPSAAPWDLSDGLYLSNVYSNAIFAPLLGSQGSMLMTMSGHAVRNGNDVYRYDAATQLFSRLTDPYGALTNAFRNGVTAFSQIIDGGGWYSDATHAEYYADTSKTTTLSDEPSAFQSYDHNVYIPPGFAGMGAKGGLLTPTRSATPGNGQFRSKQAHIMDLAGSPPVWARFGSAYSGQTGQGSACLALARGKVFMVSGQSGSSNILWTADLATAVITEPTFTASGFIFSQHGDSLRYSEAADILFVTDIGNLDGSGHKIQVIDPAGPTIYTPPTSGTWPTTLGGGEWVEADQALYYYSTGNTIYKIQPPASNPRTNTWTSTVITLTGTAVAPTGGTQHGGRLRWCPAGECFLWWADNASPVQAFRLP